MLFLCRWINASILKLKARFLLLFLFGKQKLLFFSSLLKKIKLFLIFESLPSEISLEKISIHSAQRYRCSTNRYLCTVLSPAYFAANINQYVVHSPKMLSTVTSKPSLSFLYCNCLDTQGAQASQGNNAASTDLLIITSF